MNNIYKFARLAQEFFIPKEMLFRISWALKISLQFLWFLLVFLGLFMIFAFA